MISSLVTPTFHNEEKKIHGDLGLEGLLTWKEKYWRGVLEFITIALVIYIVIYDERILKR